MARQLLQAQITIVHAVAASPLYGSGQPAVCAAAVLEQPLHAVCNCLAPCQLAVYDGLYCCSCLLQFGHLFAQGPTREAAIRAMVVALRDVRVRGEIHTIIDYAADMLQSPEFVNNEVHTGWLDSRIAANVKAERPPWHMCVIGAAAVRAHEAFACKAAEYLGFLAKGQLPPPDISLTYFQVCWAVQC